MKKLTLIIAAFLSTSFADSLEDIQIEIQSLQTNVTTIETGIETLKRQRTELRKRDGKFGVLTTERTVDPNALTEIQRLNQQIENQKKEKRSIEQHLSTLRQQERSEERRIAQAQAAHERALRAEEREHQKQERDKKREAERLDQEKKRQENLKAQQLTALKNKLRRLDVESDLSKIDFSLLNSQEELRELQSAYDKSLLGAYLQEKMAKLLESNVLCESIHSCNGETNPKTVSDISKKLDQEVFPNKSSTTTRTQPETTSRAPKVAPGAQ